MWHRKNVNKRDEVVLYCVSVRQLAGPRIGGGGGISVQQDEAAIEEICLADIVLQNWVGEGSEYITL